MNKPESDGKRTRKTLSVSGLSPTWASQHFDPLPLCSVAATLCVMPYRPARITSPSLTRASMLRIGQGALAAMSRRAFDRGLGVDDAPMAPYSPRYGAMKRRMTGHGRVDLTMTGDMRRSLRTVAAQNRTAIGRFASGWTVTISLRAPGVPDYAVYTNRRRPWFGLSPSDRSTLARVAAREIAEVIAARLAGGAS